jgi:hypothetical protein
MAGDRVYWPKVAIWYRSFKKASHKMGGGSHPPLAEEHAFERELPRILRKH